MKNIKRKSYESGEKYNRLTLLKLHTKKIGGNLWCAKCDCGKEIIATANDIRSGHTKSCGCLKIENLKERSLTHGRTDTKEYRIWCHMKGRCYNKTDAKFYRYGARGITICDRWVNSFENFLKDMGECPKGYSIDRIDNNGNYEPDNCRWADAKTQSHNSTVVKFVLLRGNKLPLSEAARRLGIYHTSIQQKSRDCGLSYQEATDYFATKRKKLT